MDITITDVVNAESTVHTKHRTKMVTCYTRVAGEGGRQSWKPTGWRLSFAAELRNAGRRRTRQMRPWGGIKKAVSFTHHVFLLFLYVKYLVNRADNSCWLVNALNDRLNRYCNCISYFLETCGTQISYKKKKAMS
jgi:hypothetical protein